MAQQPDWPSLLAKFEQADIQSRVWLSSWFVTHLARRPDILAQLWQGSSGSMDAVGWRWCEYRISGRATFPGYFLAIYDGWIDALPTAPMFVLRAPCRHCGQEGWFVTINLDQRDREARGRPAGRCAACRREAANAANRRFRARRQQPH